MDVEDRSISVLVSAITDAALCSDDEVAPVRFSPAGAAMCFRSLVLALARLVVCLIFWHLPSASPLHQAVSRAFRQFLCRRPTIAAYGYLGATPPANWLHANNRLREVRSHACVGAMRHASCRRAGCLPGA